MEQVIEQLNTEGNVPAAKFLHYWTAQLNHLLQQNPNTETSAENRSQSYLKLIQTILGDRQLVTANSTPKSSPLPNSHGVQIDPGVATATKLHPDEGGFLFAEAMPMATAAPTTSSPLPNSQIEKLLANISSELERLTVLINKHSPPSNPLWYMPILAEVETQGWIISSEEVEQLIGTKPHCAPGQNSFIRGCWNFVKAGKIGTHSSWRVIKEITMPSVSVIAASAVPNGRLIPTAEVFPSQHRTPPGSIDLELDTSPWSENS